MTLWRFCDPKDYTFATAGSRGKWGPPGQGRMQPLVLEWEPGSDVIGDFTHPLFAGPVVVEQVGEALHQRFKGFELGPVEIVQDPKLKRPTRITRRTRPRVWLPYEGPPLHELWVTALLAADLERSSFRVTDAEGSANKEPRYEAEGVETEDFHWDPVTMEGRWERKPREPGRGVYLAEQQITDADIFHVRGFTGTFCTDAVRNFVIEKEFTNADFLEMGEVF